MMEERMNLISIANQIICKEDRSTILLYVNRCSNGKDLSILKKPRGHPMSTASWFLLYSLSTVCRWTFSMTNSALSKAYIPWISPVFKAAMASFEK